MGDALDQIDDIREICDIMKSLHIPTKGLKGGEEMKEKLREFLKKKRDSEVSTPFFLSHFHNYILSKFYDSQRTETQISSLQYYC